SSTVHLTGLTPDRYSANQSVELTISGSGFVPGAQVTLVSAGQTVASASNVSISAFDRLHAFIDLNGVPEGAYDVRVVLPSGAAESLPDGCQVLPAGEPRLEVNLITPSVLGRHSSGTLYLEYANVGTAAMPAPILFVQSGDPDGSDRPLLALDRSQ